MFVKSRGVGKLEEAINLLKESAAEINEERISLLSKLSSCDLEINDLQHYLEFANLEDNEYLSLVKEMKILLNYRRELKNQIHTNKVVSDTIKNKSSEINSVLSISNSIKKVEDKINNKFYTPRVRVDLFEKLNK